MRRAAFRMLIDLAAVALVDDLLRGVELDVEATDEW